MDIGVAFVQIVDELIRWIAIIIFTFSFVQIDSAGVTCL